MKQNERKKIKQVKPTSQWEAAAEVRVGMYIAGIMSYDSGLVVSP